MNDFELFYQVIVNIVHLKVLANMIVYSFSINSGGVNA